VAERLARERSFASLARALEKRRAADPRAELAGIVREIYAALRRNRTGIKIVDRCAQDRPDLAALWFGGGREALLGLIASYLEARSRVGQMRPYPDARATARFAIETLAFWTVHRHFDPAPQVIDEAVAEETVVGFLCCALLAERRAPLQRRRRRSARRR
jgi:hypothetical protein